MRISDVFSETFISISSNKARSGLTILGVVIGIASVIAMVSIGQGAQLAIQTSIEGLGSNLLTIVPGVVQSGRGVVSSGRGAGQSLKLDDATEMKALDGVAGVSPELNQRFQITTTSGNNTNSTVVGVWPDYATVRNISIENGVFITDGHVRSLGRVAVLGSQVAIDLFGEEGAPVGKMVRVNKANFTVVGVLTKKGGSGFSSPDDTIYVPLTTMQRILLGVDYLSTIGISVTTKELMSQVQGTITSLLLQRHRVDPENPDFSIISQADILGALTQVTGTLTLFLASVAGISLVVGGIGIMNMMLTMVTERTREIGLRKAIGAKRRDISLQFLFEAIMLTFFGGLIGVLLGWGISAVISKFAGIAATVSPSSVTLAFGVSAAIGIIFGYYPARRAARLNPIEALRHE